MGLEIEQTGGSASSGKVDPMNSDKFLTGLIGYTCSYIPVEILSATGLRPYRLLHGEIGLSKKGEDFLRIDACPLVKSNVQFVIDHQKNFKTIVGSTGCDMARRFFDVIAEETEIPIYVFNNPRTDNERIYNDEIDWLVKELENFTKGKFTEEAISTKITMWESIRQQFREIDARRAANPSLVSTTAFHQAAVLYHQGNMPVSLNVEEEGSAAPRVYLLGSPVSCEANKTLSILEENLRIVGDFNCGISRFLNIKIEGAGLSDIKKAYFGQPPCIFKRPNDKFYESLNRKISETECVGVIAWTLDYCDVYEFELKRIESKIDRPMLRLKSDFSFENVGQIKTRVGAFAEMLMND